MSRQRVVIVGGGFGGLAAVQALRGADVSITMVRVPAMFWSAGIVQLVVVFPAASVPVPVTSVALSALVVSPAATV